MGDLNALDEEDYDDEFSSESAPYDPRQQAPPAKLPKSQAADVSAMEKQMRNTTLSAAAQARQHGAPVAAAAKKQVRNKGPFELSLDNATLLGRRGKKGPAPSALRDGITIG